jgi:predicted dehydrogenase
MPKPVEGVVRVLLIGSGGISRAHVNGFIKHKDKIRIVAMCDVVEGNLKSRSEQLVAGGHPAPRTFADWKTALREMGPEIDAVDICLPHHLHAPAILDACAAGKHVLCEKPMCMTLAEAETILSAVKSSGVTYMSAHNQLFMPCVREAKKMLDSGVLGRLYLIRSVDCFRGNPSGFAGSWRSKLATQGGGELIDTGYHPTYRMLHLAGTPIVPGSVRSTMGQYHIPMEGEDTAAVQVRFQSGAIGEVFTSWAMPVPHGMHQIHVVGEKGQLFGSNEKLFHLPAGAREPAQYVYDNVDTFVEEISHFADVLREGKAPLHGPAEGRAVLEVILKAAENAAGWPKL